MIKQGIMCVSASIAALTVSTAAAAQDSVPIQVTFTGAVTSGPETSIMVRQPDGSLGAYTGVTPAYNYQVNDPVSISFSTTMPTAQYLAANPQIPNVDGVVRIPLTMSQGSSGFGYVSPNNFDISGPLALNGAAQNPGMGGMSLVFDSNTGEYSIDIPSGTWAFGAVDGPSYDFDFATNTLTSNNSACVTNCFSQVGGITARGTETSVSYRGSIVGQPETAGGSEYVAGSWDMLWNGSWNMPIFGSGSGTSSGGATPVPEPSVIVLFGGAAAGLMFARRRRARKGK